ncbi:MAG: hypothetical protein JSS90_01965 [Bacteroidetes bacterium]|nr:hypothetical protein [Bacteroidota bacterium]
MNKKIVLSAVAFITALCAHGQVPTEKEGSYHLQLKISSNDSTIDIDTTFADVNSMNDYLKVNNIKLPEPPNPVAAIMPPNPPAPPCIKASHAPLPPPAPPLPPTPPTPPELKD